MADGGDPEESRNPRSRINLRFPFCNVNASSFPTSTFSAAAVNTQRLQSDLQHVIHRLGPLVERAGSQNVSLSSILSHTSQQQQRQQVESNSANPSQDFIINIGGGGNEQNIPADVHATANNGNNSGEENRTNENSDNRRNSRYETQISPELRIFCAAAEKYLPFLFILLAKIFYDHIAGIAMLLALTVTLHHTDGVIKREVARQARRNMTSLLAVSSNLITCIFFTYFVIDNESLYLSLILIPPDTDPMTFFDLMWIVGITDFILKFGTMLLKIIVVSIPAKVLPFQRKGKYYLLIERTSQLYRGLVPIQPWLHYLLESYKGASRAVSFFLSASYMVCKSLDVLRKLREWRGSCDTFLQPVSYGVCPTAEQVDGVGAVCPICQDSFNQPTMLQCKHIFCEECVTVWFDRERTCPMCRAQIADDPSWKDGSTTFFLQLF